MVRINLVPFRASRGPLFPKPVTGQELFFAVSYSKPALTHSLSVNAVFALEELAKSLIQSTTHRKWLNQKDRHFIMLTREAM